jgi:hypothetical protein
MQDILKAFNDRYNDTNNVRSYSAIVPRIFEATFNPEVKALKRDQVLRGKSMEGYPFLAINTLDGALVMFNNSQGQICYCCDPRMAQLASMSRNGFLTFGTIDSIDKFNHIFAIPDSYK